MAQNTAPQKRPGDRFDVVWVFDLDKTTGEYSFSQVPQNLLAGDQDSPISLVPGKNRQKKPQ